MQHTTKESFETAETPMRGACALLGSIAATALTMASVTVWAASGGGAATLFAAVAWPWIVAAVAWGGTSVVRRPTAPRMGHAATRRVSTLAGAHER